MINRDMPSVTIIMINYRQSLLTLKCIRTLYFYTPDVFELILINNGFDHKIKWQVELSKMKLSQWRLIENQSNIGYARSNNQGARLARADLVIFMNNDVVVAKNWMTPLLSFMKNHPRVAACQPKFHSYREQDYFDYVGGAGGFIDMFGYPFTRGRLFDSVEKDVSQYDKIVNIGWASGACLVIRRKVFLQVGGFDEIFFARGEETDLCIRLLKSGYLIKVVPSSCVVHFDGYTSNQNLPEKIYRIHRNHLYLIFKHYSVWPYFPILFVRLLFEIGALFYYLKKRELKSVWAVVRADIDLIYELPRLIAKGIITLTGKSLLSTPFVYRGTILVEYFILGRKRYSELGGKGQSATELKQHREVAYFA